MQPHPFQGHFVFHRIGLAVINLYSKFEVSKFTNYEDMKSNVKCRNWGGLGVSGHQKSLPI